MLTKDEIARRGYEIYERDIRTEVERNHDGRFLVVDVSTGRYEITNDELTAFDPGREES
jgi:repressor of nif and glnA expression